MSTTVLGDRPTGHVAPMRGGTRRWWAVADLAQLAAGRAFLTSAVLMLVYVGALVCLVAALAGNAVATPLGTAAVVLFAAAVVVTLAVCVFVALPERP